MTLQRKVLIIDKMHDSIERLMDEAGFQADYRPEITPNEVLQIIENYHGLVVRSKMPVNAVLIDRAKQLTFVARAGAGLDQIDYPLLTSKNILLVNAPEGNRDALGEHTIGMLLTLLHKLRQADQQVRAGIWDREANRGTELKGKTVGIFGCGYMGSAFAEKLKGFGCRVIAYDKYKNHLTEVEQVDLDTFRKETEILSLHVPLTSETKGLFDKAELKRYPRLKVLLNTSRGEVLDLQAVVDLLQKNQLLGVGLDVLENEKLQNLSDTQKSILTQLKSDDRVLFSPHVAGWTFESYARINEVLMRKLKEAGLVQMGV